MPASRHLRVRLTNGASLSLPVSIIPELRNATPAQLTGIEILPGGGGLHWEALDFTVSVPGLAASQRTARRAAAAGLAALRQQPPPSRRQVPILRAAEPHLGLHALGVPIAPLGHRD
jgi:hypothetical protein